jgi:MerR-like DNA binding protein
MRIGELAKSVNVNVETVRYYQRIGLLELPQKPYGGTRYYSSEAVIHPSGTADRIFVGGYSIAFRAFEF